MRVVVTRPEAEAEPLAAELEALGHEVVRCPLIRVEPLGDDPVDAHAYDWLVALCPHIQQRHQSGIGIAKQRNDKTVARFGNAE